jgi:hypothetical protein
LIITVITKKACFLHRLGLLSHKTDAVSRVLDLYEVTGEGEEEVFMPGQDGTGPRGSGPMTGKGLGFCILRIPGAPEEPFVGFAGESGRPVSFSLGKGGMHTELEGQSVHRHTRECGGLYGSRDSRKARGMRSR